MALRRSEKPAHVRDSGSTKSWPPCKMARAARLPAYFPKLMKLKSSPRRDSRPHQQRSRLPASCTCCNCFRLSHEVHMHHLSKFTIIAIPVVQFFQVSLAAHNSFQCDNVTSDASRKSPKPLQRRVSPQSVGGPARNKDHGFPTTPETLDPM